ncbi:hypothetical protein J437_LFUL013065 [Ladona fulva]|uniref:Uncharacterized protein n=1 Tax=Ladona fulva TaxID=123851 RepID=A0A8K0KG83_LADFU|nr:hypothetical protein J437_LFUL013065 [Ladona fulva]
MYTIEWQKRGLPHSLNLIWLHEKICLNQIDQVTQAEYLNPEEDPELYHTIVKNMIHGPCRRLNMNPPCMSKGKFTKRYPKTYLNETQIGEDGGFTAKYECKERCFLQMYHHSILEIQQDESFNEESKELQLKVTKLSSKVMHWD